MDAERLRIDPDPGAVDGGELAAVREADDALGDCGGIRDDGSDLRPRQERSVRGVPAIRERLEIGSDYV